MVLEAAVLCLFLCGAGVGGGCWSGFPAGGGRFEGSRGTGASAGVVGVVFVQGVVFRVRRQRKTAMVWSSVVDGWCDDCEGVVALAWVIRALARKKNGQYLCPYTLRDCARK